MKTALYALLIVQTSLIVMSVGIVIMGEASFLTYFNIVFNSIFGAININTLSNISRREK